MVASAWARSCRTRSSRRRLGMPDGCSEGERARGRRLQKRTPWLDSCMLSRPLDSPHPRVRNPPTVVPGAVLPGASDRNEKGKRSLDIQLSALLRQCRYGSRVAPRPAITRQVTRPSTCIHASASIPTTDLGAPSRPDARTKATATVMSASWNGSALLSKPRPRGARASRALLEVLMPENARL